MVRKKIKIYWSQFVASLSLLPQIIFFKLIISGVFLLFVGASETGDVVLRCGFNGMIDILNIKINATALNDQDKETMKQQCAMKMLQAPQQSPGPKRSVFCTVSRQGRTGELSVKYQCLHEPEKANGQSFYHRTGAGLLMRRQLRHFSKPDTYRKHKSRS